MKGKQRQVVFRNIHSLSFAVILVLNLSGCTGFLFAQVPVFLPSEQQKIAGYAQDLLENQFLSNLELLTHYPRNQPVESLKDHIAAMTRDALLADHVLLFNEFQPTRATGTTLEMYVNECRIQTGGTPLRNSLDLDSARYWFGRNEAGEPYVNVYTRKRMTGKNRYGQRIDFQNLVEVRVAFKYDEKQKYAHTFRVAGIDKVTQWPAEARRFTREPLVESIDLNTVASQVIGQLVTSLPVGTQQVVLEKFTYERCNKPNSLSDQLYAALNTQFPTRTGTAVSVNMADETSLRFRGWYVAGRDKLRIEAELYDPATKRVLASTSYDQLPLIWLSEKKLDWIPEGFGEVVQTNAVIATASVLPPVPNLEILLRTDRGRTGVEYWEGDTMRLWVQASQPCYLRFLNLLADGRRTILEDNFQIKPGQENQEVPIATDVPLVCGDPFGTEHLLVYASPTPFRPLPTTPQPGGYVRSEEGYQVFVGTLADVIRLSASSSDGKVAQDRIQVTSRAKGKSK